jgi:hypothetical protein
VEAVYSSVEATGLIFKGPIGYPETSVTTIKRFVTSRKSEDLQFYVFSVGTVLEIRKRGRGDSFYVSVV